MRGLLLALCVAFLAASCAEETPDRRRPATAAPPQSKEVEWTESFAEGGARLTFRVRSFEVLDDGWRSEISVTNGSRSRFSIGNPQSTFSRVFGVMLFRTGGLDEVEARNASGELPSVRRADEFRPPLPLVLEPGATWSGAISARGALASGRWVRIVFGALVPIGEPPEGFPEVLVWITDNAYRLRGGPSGSTDVR